MALDFKASSRATRSSRMMCPASLSRRHRAVSTTSYDVSPLWINLESSPTNSATQVVNAITSCRVIFSISLIRSTSKFARLRMRSMLSRNDSSFRPLPAHRKFYVEPLAIAVLRLPNGSHLLAGIAGYHTDVLSLVHRFSIKGVALGRVHPTLPRDFPADSPVGRPGADSVAPSPFATEMSPLRAALLHVITSVTRSSFRLGNFVWVRLPRLSPLRTARSGMARRAVASAFHTSSSLIAT